MGNRNLGTDKDVEAAARKARKRGWTVEITGGNHIRWAGPNGEEFRTALTASRSGVSSDLRKIRKNVAL